MNTQINFSDKETQYFTFLFNKYKNTNTNEIEGPIVASLFQKTNLDKVSSHIIII